MSIKEIKNMYAGQYTNIEVYEPMNRGRHYPNHFHTDNCNETENFTDESEVGIYSLMDIDEYNQTILANTSINTDSFGWTQDEKILCMMLV